MNIYETIEHNIESFKSVFDLAAICYDYLMAQVDNQSKFIAEYLESSDNPKRDNPNHKNLLKLSDRVKELLLYEGYWNDHALREILKIVFAAENRLKTYGMTVYNEATIAYFLLLGIDLYADHKSEINQDAPLNQNYQSNSYVYKCQKTSILSYAAEKNGFREVIQSVEIRNNFNCLKFLERTELKSGMNPPKMVTLSIDKDDFTRNSICQNQDLIVASIPFGKEEVCDFCQTSGGGFRVNYFDSYKEDGINRVLILLESAISHGANIVIFPEYVCCPEVQEAIGVRLREIYQEHPLKIKKLLLVIAGSGWTQDDNNVAAVYSYSGKLLGKHYKYASYDQSKKKSQNGRKEERLIEDLGNPGRESVIVEIPQIGSVMAAICRDVSNRDYTEKIARIFRTDFLIVPAWSRSLHHAFQSQLESITAANTNTCSIVCNCCIPTSHHVLEKGMVVTPYKKETLVVGKTRMIRLAKLKTKGCEVCKGCVFCLKLSFHLQDVEKGRILRSVRNHSI